MKTFREYLREIAHQQSRIDKMGKQWIMLPFSPEFIHDIVDGLPTITAFHISNKKNASALLKLQNTDAVVSCFTRMALRYVKGGAGPETDKNHGWISKLQGNVVLKMPSDVASEPDEKGIRWVSISTMKRAISQHSGTQWLEDLEKEALACKTRRYLEHTNQEVDDIIHEYTQEEHDAGWEDALKRDKGEQFGRYLEFLRIFDFASKASKEPKIRKVLEDMMPDYERDLLALMRKYSKKISSLVNNEWLPDSRNHDEVLITRFKVLSQQSTKNLSDNEITQIIGQD